MTFATTLARSKWVLATLVVFTAVFGFSSIASATSTIEEDARTFGVDRFEDSLELGNQDLRVTIARIINVALGLLGIVAVVIVLIGGFQYMTAGGDETKVADARKLIFSGIIGIAIILSAFAIARFVLGSLSAATGTGELDVTDDI